MRDFVAIVAIAIKPTSPSPPTNIMVQPDVSFSYVCLVIDDEFRHNIVKVVWIHEAIETTLTMLWRSCPLSLVDASHKLKIHMAVRILTIKISQLARGIFCNYHKNLLMPSFIF